MTFTIEQLWQIFLVICGAIITVGGAGTVIANFINKKKKPNKDRDDMMKKHQEMLDNDNKRLKELEDSNKVIMKSLLALMSHEIDGNHTAQLQEARDDLQEYLIKR